MENIFYGVVILLISTAGYVFAWRTCSKGDYRTAIFLLVVSGLALRLYTSADFFLHLWDERFHALVAKNMILHPFVPTLYDHPLLPYDFRNWTGNHIWLHKQPLPLWSMAASMRLFGINEMALRLPSILLTTTGIWLTYATGRHLFDKKTGFVAAFLYSINGLIIEMTAGRVATDHVDIFFLFFTGLAIYFSILFVRKERALFNILAGLSLGAALLSKWLPALIVLPVWLLLVADSGKFTLKAVMLHLFILTITFTAVALPWQIYIFRAFPQEAAWENGLNLKHMTTVIEGRSGTLFYYLNRIRISYGELIYLPLLWFLWKTFRNLQEKKRLIVTVWFLLPFLFFSFAKTKMEGYILFTAPALFLMTAVFYFEVREYMRHHRPKWICLLVLFLLIALPARYAVERIKPFSKQERRPQWVNELKDLNKEAEKKGVMFNYTRPIEAMFYSGLTVYENIPDLRTIQSLIRQGYTVIVNDDGTLPREITDTKGIIIKKLHPPPHKNDNKRE